MTTRLDIALEALRRIAKSSSESGDAWGQYGCSCFNGAEQALDDIDAALAEITLTREEAELCFAALVSAEDVWREEADDERQIGAAINGAASFDRSASAAVALSHRLEAELWGQEVEADR